MRTIVIIGGIVLAGATIVAVVQKDKKLNVPSSFQRAADLQAQPVQTPVSLDSAPKMNPKHGLPGHRCDLAVGAPLSGGSENTAPVQNPPVINMTPSQMEPAIKSPVATPSPSPAGLKTNPAHGILGHRCDLEVGAPLS